ncbi:hypothetical protein MGI18_20520 [Bacillus sp. OVS6]|nr:hypothetical protein MGI18_20520 [Bacillus sp. OVS6]
MKRLMIFILFIFLIYIVYYDMNSGTIAINSPLAAIEAPAAETKSSGSKPYTEKRSVREKPFLQLSNSFISNFQSPLIKSGKILKSLIQV